MSVVNITRMWSTDSSQSDSPKGDPNDYSFTISEGYQVLTDDPETTLLEIYNTPGLPDIGEQHPSLDAIVVARKPTRVGPIFWQIGIEYRGEVIDLGGADIEWSDVSTSEPIDQDWNGKAIVNSIGEYVDGLTMDIADQVCVISRKFFFIDTASIAAYRHSTNSDTFLGWPPGTARLVGYSAKNRYKGGAFRELWEVTARFQFRYPYNTTSAQAWYKRYRNEGLYEKVDGNIVRATDDYMQEVTKPVLLKLNGERETDPEAAVWLHAQVYGSLPYNNLGLL
jgi:hypothetical protein